MLPSIGCGCLTLGFLIAGDPTWSRRCRAWGFGRQEPCAHAGAFAALSYDWLLTTSVARYENGGRGVVTFPVIT